MRMRITGLFASGKALAAGIHLGLSACATGLLATLMFLWWYPPPFFMFDGGWQVLRLIILVDVVLGPLLTFVVFDRTKKKLKRDLGIIVVLQLAAFAYGAWIMHAYRPAFMVFAESSFHTITWRDIRRATPDLSVPAALAANSRAPAPAFLELPSDRRERARLFDAMAAGGPAITHYGAFYRKLESADFQRILREAANIDDLARGDTSIAAELMRVRAAHPTRKLGFVPVDCRYGLIMLVFDRDTLAIVDWMT